MWTFWSSRFPTVFIGIVCYALFSRRGPLGPSELLYTPWAIVCGEFLLALPLVVSITHGAVQALDPRIGRTVWTLGAGQLRRCQTYLSEARVGVTLAILTAFSRCDTELEIAMGLILLLIAIGVTVMIVSLSREEEHSNAR